MKTKTLRSSISVSFSVSHAFGRYAMHSMEDYASMLDFSSFLFIEQDENDLANNFMNEAFFIPRFMCGDSLEDTDRLPHLNPRVDFNHSCMLRSVDEAILVWGLEKMDECVNAFELYRANLSKEEKEKLDEALKRHTFYRDQL